MQSAQNMEIKDAMTLLSCSELQNMMIQKGVSEDHINAMKDTPNENNHPLDLFYEEVDKKEAIVDVEKIKGLGFRGNSGLSWFNHACRNGTDNIDFFRCKEAIEHLRKQELETFHDFYRNHPVKLMYYREEDKYFVQGDGTHRTLFAKVTGCLEIRAKVYIATINEEKYHAYQRFKQTKNKFNKVLDHYSLSLDNEGAMVSLWYKDQWAMPLHIHPPKHLEYPHKMKWDYIQTWDTQVDILADKLEYVQTITNHVHRIMKAVPDSWKENIFKILVWLHESTAVRTAYEREKKDLKSNGLQLYNIDTGSKHDTIF